jgi:glycosyltransferase involved in cell wall biosynthesis
LTPATGGLHLLVPGDPAQRTGGSLYDARIAEALRRSGVFVRVEGLAGRFPDADESARNALNAALDSIDPGQVAVIDGLALGGLPEVAAAHAERIRLVALVHHPLCDETGLDPDTAHRLKALERRALSACRSVVTTSEFTARRLAELDMDRAPITVVEPGTDPAPAARSARRGTPSDRAPRILCVGSVVPRKGQDLLIRALASLRDRAWSCTLVGSQDRDRTYATGVHSAARAAGLGGRIEWTGELDDDALQAAYHEADLFVLPSHYEGFGMVVAEALARGLPVITTTGGALIDTLPPGAGLHVPPGDPEALRMALTRWLDEPDLRARLRQSARKARGQLTGWDQAAQAFTRAIQLLPTPSLKKSNPEP